MKTHQSFKTEKLLEGNHYLRKKKKKKKKKKKN